MKKRRGTAKKRGEQEDADALHAELDDLSPVEADSFFAQMKACGCTILCMWDEERRRHIRGHIAAAELMTVTVRHSSRPDCVQLAALVAMVLRCESVADPPEGDDGSVRVLVSGRQVGAVYLGQTPRTDEWITRMAASLARSVTGAAAGFGGQGDVPTLHAAHGLERFDAAAFGRVRTAARERDRRRRTEASGLPVPATTGDVTANDRGGE